MGAELHWKTFSRCRFSEYFRLESVCILYVFSVCVFLGFLLLLAARCFSFVQSNHKIVAKFGDKFISGDVITGKKYLFK